MKVVHMHRMRGIGGSERHLLTLLPALADRGIEIAFVGLDDPEWDATPFYDELQVPASRLRCARDFEPRLAPRLRRALRSLSPDVVHTHLVHADTYGAIASIGAPWALVSTKHNDDPFRAGAFRHLERTLTRRADAVIAITDALRQFITARVGLPAGKAHVVHYGFDAPPAAWGPPGVIPDGRLLLAVARLEEQKGVDIAIRALARVRNAVPDAVLGVLGEGPERRRLQALAAELGIGDAVFLPGRVGDVAVWLDRAELLVHPARWEGFGIALLEAMLAGKPIVATRVSAIPEIVADDETGMLVPPDDPAALAAALASLLDDVAARERFGAAGRQRARAVFSVERMASGTEAVYVSALARRSGRNDR